ncbi:transporter substrate-binding domain-containing protein [Roseomonas sp. E05]|uniref:transporter substrate-binding domain-containing protein n=1 Tax=Roseomonas sp. E05 TaxID=3046310 RepID=UPI0024B8F604|nr:transporter substrate-binding domain-containing protein [Roseomonas sp. E05]MDJ0391047.1 transporter substrate-binding domain-containing protein [Roseomonas sp. E05]
MQLDRRALMALALGTLATASSALAPPVRAQAPASGETELQRIVRTKLVRVGAVEAAPWYMRDLRSDKWIGVVPEQVELIFGSIGVKVEYVPTQWGSAVAGLQSDKFDIMGAFVANPQRALVVDFTTSPYDGRNGLVVLKGEVPDGAPWSSLNKPETKVAGVDGAGSTTAIQRLIPAATWTMVQSNDALMLELDSGRVDMIASNEPTLRSYVEKRRRGKMVMPTPLITTGSNFAMRKSVDGELLRWMDTALDYFRKSGQLQMIGDKHLLGGP